MTLDKNRCPSHDWGWRSSKEEKPTDFWLALVEQTDAKERLERALNHVVLTTKQSKSKTNPAFDQVLDEAEKQGLLKYVEVKWERLFPWEFEIKEKPLPGE